MMITKGRTLETLRWILAIPFFLCGWLMMLFGDKIVNMASWVSPTRRPPPPRPMEHIHAERMSDDDVPRQDVVQFWALH